MKTYKIIAIVNLKNMLILQDPDDGSIQYYNLHSQDKASRYIVGQEVTV